jgi:hypothetical protein
VRRSPGGWKPAPQQVRAGAREVGQSLNCRIDGTRYKIKITVSYTAKYKILDLRQKA